MKAWILKEINSEKKLVLENIDEPSIKQNEVKIKVKAISLNPVDYKVTQGAFNLSTPSVVGIDAAGEIVKIGKNVSNELKVGDKVFSLINIYDTGSFAEFVSVDSSAISKMPLGLSFEDASTIPCAGITAWQAIMNKINIKAGHRVYISAGGGGVGNFAIQLAKLKGAEVITTASKDFNRLKNFGADHIINYKEESVYDKIMQITNNEGVEHSINMVPSSRLDDTKFIRHNGSFVCITGLLQEAPFPPFTKALTIAEVAIVAAYTSGDKKSLLELAKDGEKIAELLKEGKLKSVITSEINFDDLNKELEKIADGHVSGKIVVKM